MVEFREAPLLGRDAPGGGLLVPLTEICNIGYAPDETYARECHVT